MTTASSAALGSTLILSAQQHGVRPLIELANLPEQIRGFGHVKEKAVERFRVRKAELLSGKVIKRVA